MVFFTSWLKMVKKDLHIATNNEGKEINWHVLETKMRKLEKC